MGLEIIQRLYAGGVVVIERNWQIYRVHQRISGVAPGMTSFRVHKQLGLHQVDTNLMSPRFFSQMSADQQRSYLEAGRLPVMTKDEAKEALGVVREGLNTRYGRRKYPVIDRRKEIDPRYVGAWTDYDTRIVLRVWAHAVDRTNIQVTYEGYASGDAGMATENL